MSRTTFKMAMVAAAASGLLIAASAFAAPETGPGPHMGPGMTGSGEQECDFAQGMPGGPGQGYGMGPGMMGGYGHGYGAGPGMMRGYGHGYGMGLGMMGGYGQGYGMGPGMMGGYGQGYGMGPGMMGGYGLGYGMGPGMMGGYGQGYGMGPGMMGYGGAAGLSLSDEQRTKAIKIQDGTRKKMWENMGAMFDASSKLRELLSESTRDRAAIGAAYKKISELRQKMFEAGLDAQEEFERILTPDQRRQLGR